MLDTFEILTTSGVVLWSKTYSPVSGNVINSLINDVFIEERGKVQCDTVLKMHRRRAIPPYKKDRYTLKWATAKDLGLMFVVRTFFFRYLFIMTAANSYKNRLYTNHYFICHG